MADRPGQGAQPHSLYLICTELFGNGSSSSPSNTPEPFHGARFPVTSIRDNVEAVHKLLTEQLGITHLKAIIGFSMGAQQAFQWAVSYPDFTSRIVATSGTAKTWPHGIVRLEGQIAALTADPAFNNGDYASPPADRSRSVWYGLGGVALFPGMVAPRALEDLQPSGTTFEQYMASFKKRFSADANDYILQACTWEKHDISATRGFNGDIQKALGAIKVPFLHMPSETDLYFPLGDARYESQFMPTVAFQPIPSL